MGKGHGVVRYAPGDLVLAWGFEAAIVIRRDGDEYFTLLGGERYWVHAKDLTLLSRRADDKHTR